MKFSFSLSSCVALGMLFFQTSVFGHAGDPTGALLEYAIYGVDSLFGPSFGITVKTVDSGAVGSANKIKMADNWILTFGGPLKSTGEVDIGKGDTLNRFLKMGAEIQGNVSIGGFTLQDSLKYSGTLTNEGEIVGSSYLVSDAGVSVPALSIPTNTDTSTSTENCVFGDGAAASKWTCDSGTYDTLPAGSYGNLTASWNHGNKPLLFGEGLYKIDSLDANALNVLVLNNSNYTRLIINRKFRMSGGLGQWVRSNDSTSASDSVYNGKVLIRVESTNDEALTIAAGGTRISATLMAPNGKLKLPANLLHFGQVLAKSIEFQDGYDGTEGRFIPFGGIVVATAPTKTGDLGVPIVKSEDFTDTVKIDLDGVFTGATTYSLTRSDTVVSSSITSDSLIFFAVADSNGVDTLILTATNATGSISDTLIVTVNAVDDAPRVVGSGIPDTTATNATNTDIPLGTLITDPEGDAITYSIDSIFQSKVTASIIAPDTLRIRAKDGETGTDTVIVKAVSNGLITYDTLVVTLGSTAPYKTGDLGVPIVKSEDFTDTVKIDLDGVFTGATTYSLTRSDTVVSSSITSDSLIFFAVADSNGVDTLILTATNATGSISDTLIVTVNAVDDAPRVVGSGVPDTTATNATNTDIPLGTLITDPEGDAITYSIDSIFQSKVTASIIAPDTLRIRAKDGETGTDTVIVKAVSNGLITYDTLVVTLGSTAPYKTGDLGVPIVKSEDFTDTVKIDLDGVFTGATTYSLTRSDTVVSSSITSDSLIFFAVADSNGVDTLILTATNATGSISDTLIVTVNAVDDAPRVVGSGIPDTTATSVTDTDIPLGTLITDPEGDAITYSIDSIFQSKVTASIVAPDTLRIKALVGQTGVDTVIVKAVSNGLIAYDTLVVTLAGTAPTKTGDLGVPIVKLEDFTDTVKIDLDGVFTSATTYSVTRSDTIVSSSISSDSLIFLAIADSNGIDTLIVTATNPSGSVSDTLIITVTAVDDAPRIVAPGIPDTTATNTENTNIPLTPLITDPEGDAVTYSIHSIAQSKVTALIVSPNTLQIKAKNGVSGSDTVIVKAESNGLITYDTLVVTLKDIAPTKKAILGTLSKDEDFTETDKTSLKNIFEDDNELVYTVTVKNGIVDASVVGDSLIIKAIANKNGLDTVIVRATDTVGVDAFIEDTLYINIAAIDDEVVIGEIPDKTLKVGEENVVDLKTIIVDPDGTTPVISVTSLKKVVDVSIVDGVLTVKTKTGVTGLDTIVVSITDTTVSPHKIKTDTLIVDVPNHAPDLINPNIVVPENSKVGMPLVFVGKEDDDGDVVTIKQLNYTADFALRGDSLIVKQAFSLEDSVYVVRFSLSDGKVTTTKELTIRLKNGLRAVTSLQAQIPKNWKLTENSLWIQGDFSQILVYDLQGRLVLQGITNQLISISSLALHSKYIVRSQGKTILFTRGQHDF